MPEIPDLPDDWTDEEELQEVIDELDTIIAHSEAENTEFRETLTEIEEQIANNSDSLEQAHSKLDELIHELEDIELHGTPNVDELQESLRNPDFGNK